MNAKGEESVSQVVVDGLGSDELVELTARKGEGTIRVSIPHGLTQCGGQQVRFRAVHYITKEEYDRRMKRPWPAVEDYPGTLAALTRDQTPAAKLPVKGKRSLVAATATKTESAFQKAAKTILRDKPKLKPR